MANLILGDYYQIYENGHTLQFMPVESLSSDCYVMVCAYYNYFVLNTNEWPAYVLNNYSWYNNGYTNKDISNISNGLNILNVYNIVKKYEHNSYKYGMYLIPYSKLSNSRTGTLLSNYYTRAFEAYDKGYIWTGTYGYSHTVSNNYDESLTYHTAIIYDPENKRLKEWIQDDYNNDNNDYYSYSQLDVDKLYPEVIPIFNIDTNKINIEDQGNGYHTISLKQSTPIYLGNSSNKAVDISGASKIYIGDSNNQAKQVSKIYIGNSNNKSVLIYG